MDFTKILAIYQDAKSPPKWVEDDMSPLFIKLGHINLTPHTAAALIHRVLIVELGGKFEDPSSDSDSDNDGGNDTKTNSLAVKACVRMNISGYDLMCTIKATIVLLWDSKLNESVLTIDFARRFGDALCFGLAFRKARDYMNCVTVDSDGHINYPVLLPSEPMPVCAELDAELPVELPVEEHKAVLQPLVAMLEESSSSVLQQEAITALSAIASSSDTNKAVVSSTLANSRFKGLVLDTL